ncbi:MAG: phosphoribosylanthranilate isomerase [Betaproteobacteria bacterium]|nr:phosphoribosylanthranilate isomerase [Betaproteobacteria bacterium]
MKQRTRIKICGLTRKEDVQAAVKSGADALGFVFYPESPRYVTPSVAGELIAAVPPFVTTVGLFVNMPKQDVVRIAAQTGISLLQFHGDETVEFCTKTAMAANLPFIRAFRVKPDTNPQDLVQFEQKYRAAGNYFSGLLLDSYSDVYGGTGKVFNWSLISKEIAHQVVLSGGLSEQNVAGAIKQVQPYAVDVSSGVESGRGIKDAGKIRAFISAVNVADRTPG